MPRYTKWAPWVLVSLGLAALPVTSAPQAATRSVKIPDGTVVRLALMEALSSAKSEVNDPVPFEAVEDVRISDVVVIAKGSAGTGHIADVEKKKRLGRGGKLNFAVDYVKGFDGSNLRLRASSSTMGKDKTSVATLPVLPIVLLMHGKDVNIPRGTQFNAYVDGDREIALAAPPPAAPVAAPAAASVAPPVAPTEEELSTFVLKSNPDGAEVSINGKFVGSTPSTLRLPPGDHQVSIEKGGFKPWKRTMSVSSGGIVTINANLEKAD